MKLTKDLNKECNEISKQRTKEVQGKLAETEHPKTKFLVFPLKVVVSPFRAFKEIAQNPDFKGIVLIAGLILIATAGSYCAYSAKVFIYINGTSTSFLASSMFSVSIAAVLIQGALFFAENWLLYAGVLFLVMRVFGQKGGSWRLFFILMGYAFSIMIIQSVVSALLFATLPEIHFSNLSTWPPSTEDELAIASAGIQENWGSMPAFQALVYFNFPVNIIDIWLVLLTVMIVHTFSEITWGKAAMISVTAFILRLFLGTFLGL